MKENVKIDIAGNLLSYGVQTKIPTYLRYKCLVCGQYQDIHQLYHRGIMFNLTPINCSNCSCKNKKLFEIIYKDSIFTPMRELVIQKLAADKIRVLIFGDLSKGNPNERCIRVDNFYLIRITGVYIAIQNHLSKKNLFEKVLIATSLSEPEKCVVCNFNIATVSTESGMWYCSDHARERGFL